MKKMALGLAMVSLVLCFPLISLSAEPAAALLDDVTGRVASTLNVIDGDLAKAARQVGEGVSPAAGMRQALHNLCTGKEYAIDCVFINAKGIMEIIEPEKYRKHEGTDLSKHDIIRRIQTTRKPLLSELFASTEGFQGVVLQYPVFTRQKEFAGSVSLFVMPELLVQHAIRNVKLGGGTGITIVQADGTNVYSSDPGQNRLNVLTSPEYKSFTELRGMVQRIIKEKEGAGTYRYVKPGTGIVVRKNALWKTVSLYDGFWRIVVTTEKR